MLSQDHQTCVLIQLVHRNCNESPYVPCGICLYAEYIQYICSAIESEVVEALAMFRLPACGACGCLMRPGARLPNAQQSVAQATTAGLALYNCSYTCTYVHTCTIVNTAGPAFVPHKCTMLLEYNAQNLGRLESQPYRLFCAHILHNFQCFAICDDGLN